MINFTGNIKDVQTGALIPDAYIQETYFNADTKAITPFGDQIPCPGGVYSVNVSSIDSNHYFLVTAPGYNIFYANDPVFNTTPDVNLLKTTGTEKLLIPAGAILLLLLLSQKKKTSVGKVETKDVMPYILIAGAAVALGLVKKITDLFGLTQSANKANIQSLENDPGSYWKPAYWRKFSSYPSGALNIDQANSILNSITDSFGFFQWTPNIAQLNAAFGQLTSKSEVSFLADIFQRNTGKDLLSYMDDPGTLATGLSADALTNLNNMLNQLPTN